MRVSWIDFDEIFLVRFFIAGKNEQTVIKIARKVPNYAKNLANSNNKKHDFLDQKRIF